MVSDWNSSRDAQLPYWLTSMELDDQIYVTGATVVLGQVLVRRPELGAVLNEGAILEAESPRDVVALATELAEQFADRPPRWAPDGLDDNWRISSLSAAIAERVSNYYPEAAGLRSIA
jgi:hypothetical protein